MTTDKTLYFDKSGLQVTQKLHGVYVASTQRVTCSHIDLKRGHEGIERAGILPHRTGNSIHDDSPAYYGYTVAARAERHRHHLRELAFLQKRYPQPWQPALAKHLAKINQAIATAKAARLTELTPAQITAFETRYTELVDQGLQLNPVPPSRLGNGADRLIFSASGYQCTRARPVCLSAQSVGAPARPERGLGGAGRAGDGAAQSRGTDV